MNIDICCNIRWNRKFNVTRQQFVWILCDVQWDKDIERWWGEKEWAIKRFIQFEIVKKNAKPKNSFWIISICNAYIEFQRIWFYLLYVENIVVSNTETLLIVLQHIKNKKESGKSALLGNVFVTKSWVTVWIYGHITQRKYRFHWIDTQQINL